MERNLPDDATVLDDLLGNWAAGHTLSASKSKSIRASLLEMARTEPVELSPEWWQRVFRCAGTVSGGAPPSFWPRVFPAPLPT